MKTLLFLTAGLLLAPSLPAQSGKVTATATTQTKPNYFGETKTVVKDPGGKVVGEAVTQTKPNYFGETKTTFKDSSGKTIGEAVTQTKPNYFGETKTTVKGATPLSQPSKSKR